MLSLSRFALKQSIRLQRTCFEDPHRVDCRSPQAPAATFVQLDDVTTAPFPWRPVSANLIAGSEGSNRWDGIA